MAQDWIVYLVATIVFFEIVRRMIRLVRHRPRDFCSGCPGRDTCNTVRSVSRPHRSRPSSCGDDGYRAGEAPQATSERRTER